MFNIEGRLTSNSKSIASVETYDRAHKCNYLFKNLIIYVIHICSITFKSLNQFYLLIKLEIKSHMEILKLVIRDEQENLFSSPNHF